MSSTWAAALFGHVCDTVDEFAAGERFVDQKQDARSWLGYAFFSPVTTDDSILAFASPAGLRSLCANMLDGEGQARLREICGERERSAQEVRAQLDMAESHPDDALGWLLIRNVLLTSTSLDATIFEWAKTGNEISTFLLRANDAALERCLEVFHVIQQRADDDIAIRLAHIVAKAIESCDSKDRATQLFTSLLFLSHNGGLVSPLQRSLESRWKSAFVETAKTWRSNARLLSRMYGGWIASRCRSTSAAMSRLLGPDIETNQ